MMYDVCVYQHPFIEIKYAATDSKTRVSIFLSAIIAVLTLIEAHLQVK